jgi:hypothetical protein
MKTCKKRGSTEFYKDGRCKPCRAKNETAYITRNYEKIKLSRDKTRHENHEHVLELKRKYRERHREILAAKQRAYREKHVDRENERARVWATENPDRSKELRKNYYKNNKVKFTQNSIERRSKLAKTGRLTVGLEKRLFKLQKGKWACCGDYLGDNYHLDHIMPLALGGSNTDDNIQLLKAWCNLSKHAKHPVDFMQSKGFLI